MNSKRVIYYYQTFNGLGPLLKNPTCSHLHISAIHFGVNPDKSLYIHLNDFPPSEPRFDSMWEEAEQMAKQNVQIILMIGGAGGGYQELFSNFKAYYAMLRCCLLDHPFITGVDLDIEEYVALTDVQKLIRQIKSDFPDFTIAMAPIQSSLQNDVPGMGGFCYKDLYHSPEGQMIDYFNGQFYTDYSVTAYTQVIENGYPVHQVVMGMTSEMFTDQTKEEIENTLQELVKTYPEFGGVFDWEQFNAYPEWSEIMTKVIDPPLWFGW